MTETRLGMLLVISGPSGTGKGTLCDRLLMSDPSFRFSVSATTRQPREGESEGIHYRFVSDQQFDALIQQDAFLEHTTVHGHRYGTYRQPIEEGVREGYNMLLDIDSKGAISVMKRVPDCVSVFILPPDFEALRVRLHTRNTDDPEEINRRLKNAREEMGKLACYQYVLINDDLELAYERLYCIVAAEKQRTIRYFPRIEVN